MNDIKESPKYVYSFKIDSEFKTWPKPIGDIFRIICSEIEIVTTEKEFNQIREEAESVDLKFLNISRRPFGTIEKVK